MRALLVEDVIETLARESLLDILDYFCMSFRQGVDRCSRLDRGGGHSESSGLVVFEEKCNELLGDECCIGDPFISGKKSIFSL